MGCRTILIFEVLEVFCHTCGQYRHLRPPWIAPYTYCTRRLLFFVAQLCRFMSCSDAAQLAYLSPSTARRIDIRHLLETYAEPDLESVRRIGVDEVAVKKGHRYFTIVVDLDRARVLHVGEGRSEPSLGQFYQRMTPAQRERIEAVAMDMWQPYEAATRRFCPRAEIVYDKFHIFKAYGDVVDSVRRAAYDNATTEGKAVIKGSRYLLLRRNDSLSGDQAAHLCELLRLNRDLEVTYQLHEALRRLWAYRDPTLIQTLLRDWCLTAWQTGIRALHQFASRLWRHARGIVAFAKHRISTARVESLNNLIGLIKRRAFGIRDPHYFRLKIFQVYTLKC
jgi:transposase